VISEAQFLARETMVDLNQSCSAQHGSAVTGKSTHRHHFLKKNCDKRSAVFRKRNEDGFEPSQFF